MVFQLHIRFFSFFPLQAILHPLAYSRNVRTKTAIGQCGHSSFLHHIFHARRVDVWSFINQKINFIILFLFLDDGGKNKKLISSQQRRYALVVETQCFTLQWKKEVRKKKMTLKNFVMRKSFLFSFSSSLSFNKLFPWTLVPFFLQFWANQLKYSTRVWMWRKKSVYSQIRKLLRLRIHQVTFDELSQC